MKPEKYRSNLCDQKGSAFAVRAVTQESTSCIDQMCIRLCLCVCVLYTHMAIGIKFFYFSNIVLSLIIFVLLSFKIIRTPERSNKIISTRQVFSFLLNCSNVNCKIWICVLHAVFLLGYVTTGNLNMKIKNYIINPCVAT